MVSLPEYAELVSELCELRLLFWYSSGRIAALYCGAYRQQQQQQQQQQNKTNGAVIKKIR